MKKTFLTLLVAVACTVTLHAQRYGGNFQDTIFPISANRDIYTAITYRICSHDLVEVGLEKATSHDISILRKSTIYTFNEVTNNGRTYDITTVFREAFSEHEHIDTVTFTKLKSLNYFAFTGSHITKLDLSACPMSNIAPAFNESDIKTVLLPPTVTIASVAFKNSEIEEIIITGGGSLSQILPQTFLNCTKLRSIDLSHVESIGEFAFMNCTSLSDVSLPECKTIEKEAFMDSKLQSLTLYNTTTSFGTQTRDMMASNGTVTMHIVGWSNKNVLANHTGVPMTINYIYNNAPVTGNYTIPNTVTTLGQGALYHAAGLTGITLPASLTKIGAYAFAKCTSLTSITSNATKAPAVDNANAFAEVNKSIPVTIPDNATTYYSYRTTTGWKDFTNYQVSLQTAKDVAIMMLNDACKGHSAPSIIELLSDYITQINAATSKAEVDSLYAEAINALPLAIAKLECIDAVKAAAVGVVSDNLQALIDGYVTRINAATTIQAAEKVRDEAKAAFQLMKDKQPMLDELESMKEGVQSEAILNKIQSYIDYISNPSTTLDQATTKYNEALPKLGDLLEGYKEGEKVGKAEGAAEAYSAPTEPGMRLKVTKTDGKVYEFQVTDVESTEYYRATE